MAGHSLKNPHYKLPACNSCDGEKKKEKKKVIIIEIIKKCKKQCDSVHAKACVVHKSCLSE